MTFIRRLILPIFVLLATTSALSVEINPEINQLEKAIESKVLESIKLFYGDNTRAAVSARITEDVKAIEKRLPQEDTDIGYAPFAYMDEQGVLDLGTKRISIQSLSVDIQIPEDADPTLDEGVKTLVNKTLAKYSPAVSISRVALPKRQNPTAPTERDEAKPNSPWETLKFFMPVLTAIAASLILLLGIIFIASALKSTARSIIDGLHDTRANVNVSTNNKPALIELSGDGEMGTESLDQKEEKPKEPESLGPVSSLKDYARNIELIQQLIRENVSLVLQTLQNNDTEWLGLKSLLPCLSPQEQDILRQALGPTRVNRLVETQAAHPDPVRWIQEFTERLMLKKIQGGSATERAIGPAGAVSLTLATWRQLVSAAREVNSPAAWRVVADFIAKDQLASIIDELTPDQWRSLLSSSEIAPTELQKVAASMIKYVQSHPDGDTLNEQKMHYYSNTLLDPVLARVTAKALGEDDAYIDEIEENAPELAQMVRRQIWTPKQLDLVPDDYLGSTFRRIPMEDKAAFLIAVPSQYVERMMNLLPPGNMKVILTDQIQKAHQRRDPRELKAAIERARKFLALLKRDAEAGKFKLRAVAGDMERAA